MIPAPFSFLRIIKDFVADRLPSMLPISLPDFLLDGLAQAPEVPVVIAKDVVRQLVAKRVPDDLVVPIPIIRIRPQSQLDDLASVPVQAQGARFVRRVLGGIHLGQDADTELVLAHACLDAGIIAQTLEEPLRTRQAGEVVEWEDGLEGVGRLVLGFLPVAMAIRGHGFAGSTGGLRAGARRCEGGELGGRGRKKDYLL